MSKHLRKTKKSQRKTKRRNTPWNLHVKKTMKQHPDWMLKDVLKSASKTYKQSLLI